jgi:hypothetical protein
MVAAAAAVDREDCNRVEVDELPYPRVELRPGDDCFFAMSLL